MAVHDGRNLRSDAFTLVSQHPVTGDRTAGAGLLFSVATERSSVSIKSLERTNRQSKLNSKGLLLSSAYTPKTVLLLPILLYLHVKNISLEIISEERESSS